MRHRKEHRYNHMNPLKPYARVQEWWYWNVTRRTNKFIPWVATTLVPERIKYYVIIAVAVRTAKESNPGSVSALKMLDSFEKASEY